MRRIISSLKSKPRNLVLMATALAVVVGGTAGTAAVANAAGKKITKSVIYYETYIPKQYVDAPEGLPGTCDDGADWWYGGDNRGRGFNTGKFRTQVVITFDFKNKKWGFRQKIRPTTRYKKVNGKLIPDSSRTAGGEGIKVEGQPQISSKTGNIAVTHAAGNPFCAPLTAINYSVVMNVSQNGKIGVSGSHDRMPNHEMWRQDFYSNGSKSQKMIFSHTMRDPLCLVEPICPVQPISVNK